MAMQRNSIARQLPWEIRELVCRMRFDGAGNQAICAAVAAACKPAGIATPRIHGTSILAYAGSAEYTTYCDRRRQWDDRMAPKRWAAAMLHDGAGPQSVADLAELEILEQLHGLAAGGLLETGKDVANVARAITAMQRTQLARRGEDSEARIAELMEKHAAQIGTLQAAVVGRDEAITGLKAEIERLLNPSLADAAGLSDAEKAKRIRERLGI